MTQDSHSATASPGQDRPAAAPAKADRPALSTRVSSRTDVWVWLIAMLAFAAYATISLSRYLRLDPGSWDLALFTEYVKKLAHLQAPIVVIKKAGFNLLGDHFTPIVALLAPLFRLFPTPATLLVSQAALTAISTFPVARVARLKLGTGVSRAVAVAYALSWGLAAMVNFDFHEVAFAVPLLAFSLAALMLGKPKAGLAWALPLVFVKEDQGFTVAAVGVVMVGAAIAARRGRGWLAGRNDARTWAWAGATLVVWGLAGSLLAITVIIPHFNPAHHYVYWRDGGVLGRGGKHFSAAGLLAQLGHAAPVKLRTLILLLLPAAFLALRSPLALIVVPSVGMRFLSTHSVFWGTGFHYNATAMPILFLAGLDGMTRLAANPGRLPPGRRARAWDVAGTPLGQAVPRYGAALMVVIGVGLAFRFPLAQLTRPATYTVNPHVRAENAAMAKVPAGVTVESTESTLAPMAARDTTSWLVTDGIRDPRYVLYDALRTGEHPPPADPPQFVRDQHPAAVYRTVFHSHHVYLFERVTSAR